MRSLQESLKSSLFEAINVPELPNAGQEIFDLMSDTDVNKVGSELDSILGSLPQGTHQNAKEICQDNVLVIYGLVTNSRKYQPYVELTLITVEDNRSHFLKISWLYGQPATEWVTYSVSSVGAIRNRKDDKDFKYVVASKSLFNELVKLTAKIAHKQ